MSERRRAYLLPALAAVALFAVAAVIGYVTKSDPSLPSADEFAAVSAPGTRGTVQSLTGDTLTIQADGGPRQFTLASGASIEALRPATAASITAGEWLNVGASPNSQTMFTLVGLTLIPQALLQSR